MSSSRCAMYSKQCEQKANQNQNIFKTRAFSIEFAKRRIKNYKKRFRLKKVDHKNKITSVCASYFVIKVKIFEKKLSFCMSH